MLGDLTMKFTLLTLILAVILAACSTRAADTGDTQAEPVGNTAGKMGMGGKGAFRQKLLEKFDANKDGKLEPDELAAAKAAMKEKLLAKFDTNHNGTLDPDERAAMKAAIEQRRAQRQAQGGQGQAGQGGRRFGKGHAGNAKKTTSTDSTSPSDNDTVQKVIDQIDAKPSVKF